MKFSFSWLKDHLETEATVEEISEKLSAIGLEVEGVENPADRLAGFRVARVLTAERHPNADKLQVLSVDTGDGEVLQVVCGAPNARAGLVGVLGLPGAVVPAGGFELKKSAIRGVESNGMMCSVRELELGEEHDGIIELPADAPVGMAFAQYHGADPVFDIAITPNRPDCMGVDGIARDLAAAGLGSYLHKPATYQAIEGAFPCPVTIRVEADSGCRVFWGRVIRGVRNGPSPQWLQDRLKSAGLRPISALVDITNYFSVDRARPLHVYDLAKLQGGIVARRGRAGESFLALNDKSYTVTPEDCVIADDAAVLGLGGVIGGADTGVGEHTTDVLLECAWFDPEMIARTGQRHMVTTDARQRFERGIDPMMLSVSIESAAQMIVDLCGGEVSAPVMAGAFPADGYPENPKRVAFSPEMTLRLGGIDIPAQEQRNILGRLGFIAEEPVEAASWNLLVPTWRPDIDGWADIVEEVVRIHGIDRIESAPLPRTDGVARPTATPAQQVEAKLRRAAASLGLNEAITWSFISEAEAARVGGGTWVLDNPISEDMKVMRPSLLPGLLSAVQRNLDRGASTVRLFELGRRYLADGEHPTLVLVMAGTRDARQWSSGKARAFDAFDAKAAALELLRVAGAPVDNLQVMGDAGSFYHPGQSATLRLGPKSVLASFGMVHPATLKAFGIDAPVAIAGIHIDAIPAKKSSGFARAPYAPPALQAVTRDFAFLVDAALPAGDLVRTVKGADKANIAAVKVFDDFRGRGVSGGQKSLAVEVTLQPGEKSFDEAELKAIAERVTSAAAKLGAVLRG